MYKIEIYNIDEYKDYYKKQRIPELVKGLPEQLQALANDAIEAVFTDLKAEGFKLYSDVTKMEEEPKPNTKEEPKQPQLNKATKKSFMNRLRGE